MDAQDLTGVVIHGSPRMRLNDLEWELFWFVLERRIVMSVEWVPREQNTLADDLSKRIIPDDKMLRRKLFQQLEQHWGRHLVDIFAFNANNQCERFYSLHWCRGTAGINAFAFNLGIGLVWFNGPYRLLGRVWRKLRHDEATATVLVPLWQSATW